jgi:hypothetical protein
VRKLRDAGVLEGKKPGERIGRLSPEQAEIARLRREIEDETASGHDGGGVGDHVKNARALGRTVEELAGRTTAHEALMSA